MSQMQTAIFGAIAVAVTLGAVELAFGHDLSSGLRVFSAAPEAENPTAENPTMDQVNRAAKADRAGSLMAGSVPTMTISIHVDRVVDTSVMVRMPLPEEARSTPPAPTSISTRPSVQRTVACEPVVSVLTEIAKRLQPGRCVT